MRAGETPREPRINVCVPCRMNHGGRWTDVRLRNASSRGLLIECSEAPQPGAYVDIRRGSMIIIARVMWRRSSWFGVRTQDRIVPTLLAGQARSDEQARADSDAAIERRSADRASARRRATEGAERAKRLAGVAQFVSVLIVAIAIGGMAAAYVYELLSRPAGLVAIALGN